MLEKQKIGKEKLEDSEIIEIIKDLENEKL